MAKSINSERQNRLAELIRAHRRSAGLSQADVARAMGRHQPFIVNIESGQRRVDLIEFLKLATIIGFDEHEIITELARMKD